VARRCPDCDASLPDVARYCLYCGRPLDGTSDGGRSDRDRRERVEEDDDGRGAPTIGGTTDRRAADRDGPVPRSRLVPDWTDDALVLAVAVVAGVVVAGLWTVGGLLATADGRGLVPGPVGGVLAGVLVGRRGTVRGAVTRAGYAVAVSLALLPVSLYGPAGARQPTPVVFLGVAAAFAGVAGVVALAGYAVSHDLTDLLG